MTCDEIRTALSARLDGEDPGLPDEVVDQHVARCAACAAWAEGAAAVTRRVRLRVAVPADDLTDAVVSALRATAATAPAQPLVRGLLAATALLQIMLSLPALVVGEQAAAGLHVAREIGATEVALAVGVLAAAWRPWRAAGMLPVVVALAIGLSGTTVVDLVANHTLALHELPHLVTLVEAYLVWRLRRQGLAPRTAPDAGSRQLRRVA